MSESRATPHTSRPAPARKAALEMIDEGNLLEEQGKVSEAMVRYNAAVQTDPQCARAHLNRGNILINGSQVEEARRAYLRAIACDPQYAAAHFNLGNLNYHAGEFEQALRDFKTAVSIKPDFADAFVAMANALENLQRIGEAEESFKRALAINPRYAEVHFNLGMLAAAQGRYDEAVSRLHSALEIRPGYVQAHRTLATVFFRLNRLDLAETSLRRAFSIEPSSAEILHDLAMILSASSRSPEAVELIVRNLDRAPAWSTKIAFASCVARTRFMADDAAIRAALVTAITEPWGSPYELCQPGLSLIMRNPRIAKCVRLANRAWPLRLPKATLFDADDLHTIGSEPLLNALLATTPVTTIEFERFLTCARHALLETASSTQSHDPLAGAALQFYAALSLQCFLNDYVFDFDDKERLAALSCRARLLALLDARAAVPPLLLLAVAAYFPLYKLPDANRLLNPNEQDPIDEVLRRQVREPLEEEALRAGIQTLTPIADGVSEEVRDQYEENPYPQWVKLPMSDKPLRFNDELRRTFPLGRFTPMADDAAPDVLIAGCGTGSQPIIFSQRFHGVRILAIDLSLTSISFALRKTRELGITNIAYAQADILGVGDIDRTFDIIESVGVLHHLADPFAGWRALLSRLRPGGFMGLGLYSEIARRHVVKAREFIAMRGYGSTSEEIRRCRRELAPEVAGADLQWLTGSRDFYSMSECRDLLFHVQEHRLTLGKIETFLSELGLHFIGFELDPRALFQYRARFPDDPSCTNLSNWTRFETDNPDTFAGMYRFWIQQPIQ